MSKLIRGLSKNGVVVFCGVDSTEIVRRAEQLHKTSATCSATLGRLLTGAAMMGSMQKDDRDTVTLRLSGGGPAERGAVAGGVMVGEGHDVQPRQGAHGRQVGRGHVLAAAGRQAGVKVEVIVIFQEKHRLSGQSGAGLPVARPRRRRVQAFLPEAKTLPQGGFTPPEEVKSRGPRRAEDLWGDRRE